jgi:tetratricopeptide (TPR) repeat protein
MKDGKARNKKPSPMKLERAFALFRRHDADGALAIARSVHEAYPENQHAALLVLVSLLEKEELDEALPIAAKLYTDGFPDRREFLAGLSDAFLLYGFILTGRTLRDRLLELFPNSEEAEIMGDGAEEFTAMLKEYLEEIGIRNNDGYLAAQNTERFRLAVLAGNTEKAIELSCTAALGFVGRSFETVTLCETLWDSGRMDEAASVVRSWFASDPDEMDAWYLVMMILPPQAAEVPDVTKRVVGYADRILSRPDESPGADPHPTDIKVVIDILCRAGEFDRIPALFELLPDEERQPDSDVFRLTAAAYARLGKTRKAKSMWRLVSETVADDYLVDANLEDLERKPGNRWGGFCFTLNELVPRICGHYLRAMYEKYAESEDIAVPVAKWEAEHPFAGAVLAKALFLCEPEGIEFILECARHIKSTELQNAVKEFARGRFGTDEIRLKAARIAAGWSGDRNGAEVFYSGEMRRAAALVEITNAPVNVYEPQVQRRLEKAHDALIAGDVKTAASIFEDLVAQGNRTPDILFNMASAYNRQGRKQEADSWIDRIHAEFPDYFFARAALAIRALDDGNVTLAKAFTEPFLGRRRYHVSEYKELCNLMFLIESADGNIDGMWQWIDSIEDFDPENPHLPEFYLRVRFGEASKRIARDEKKRAARKIAKPGEPKSSTAIRQPGLFG